MVIRYEPAGPSDLLGCRTLVEVCEALHGPLIIGAWMTRAIVLSHVPEMRVRRTNDVDVAVLPEVAAASDAARLLLDAGYRRDEHGYDFRYVRTTPEGVQIVDLMIDASAPSPGTFSVFGLGEASVTTDDVTIDIQSVGMGSFKVPSMDGAFLLRLLALADGSSSLKFDDYAADAGQLALLLVDDSEAMAAWRRRVGAGVQRARQIAGPLFESERAAGSIAAARRLGRDETIAARRVSAAMRDLLSGKRRDGR